MGMNTVNMPGGEIVPSAERGVIDCAEWVGGVEDMRSACPRCGSTTTRLARTKWFVGAIFFNSEVWAALRRSSRRRSARPPPKSSCAGGKVAEAERGCHRGDADRARHANPAHSPEIMTEFFKAWDAIAQEEMAVNPFFKKV